MAMKTENQSCKEKPKKEWLKKYTNLKFLRTLLENRQLYLGDPGEWEDKNDSELIQLYSDSKGLNKVRATCLTSASDRYHFWDIFGNKEAGVCLWFDPMKLKSDIKKVSSLIAGDVKYLMEDSLREQNPSDIPFAKRIQYKDEREFRVIREGDSNQCASDWFAFSPTSLKRIYLNGWLNDSEVKKEKCGIKTYLNKGYGHVKVCQNKTIRKQSWIDAANVALKNN